MEMSTARMERAFRKLESEIRAVPSSEYAALNVDVQAAVATVLAAVPQLQELRPEIEAITSLDLTLYDRLEEYALALAYAHGTYLVAAARESPEELAREAMDVRRLLLSDAQALATRGLIDASRLRDVGGRMGYRNTAFDLVGLVSMMREAWSRIEGKTPTTLAELEHAEALADRLLIEVGERGRPLVKEAQRDRAAAYTLFLRAYRHADRLIEFLRYVEGDADQILPSLYADKGRRRPTASSEEPTDLSESELPLPMLPPSGSSEGPSDSTAPAQSMVRGPVLGEEFPAQAAGMPGLPGVDPFKD